MHLKHGQIRLGCIKQSNLLAVLGWVALGPNFSTYNGLGWVGSGQSADGLGWIGSHKMDPWTTLEDHATYHTRRKGPHSRPGDAALKRSSTHATR